MKKHSFHKGITGYFIAFFFLSCTAGGKKAPEQTNQDTNKYRSAIELIVEDERITESITGMLQQLPLDCYRWKNHIVLFGEAADTTGLSRLISQTGFRIKKKLFNKPFYIFDKAKNCTDNTVVESWKDYLLTANLVDDSLAQAEYIHYHAIQFDEWPEVAEGFCLAGFQQLLAFRSGRQLLLVISIPAGKTLDELNPKTIENNPRMVEWNNLMSNYQVGIGGTEPDETWVFLNKVE